MITVKTKNLFDPAFLIMKRMEYQKKWGCILICLCLIGISSCASGSTKRSVGQIIDDAVISNKIKLRYLKDKIVKGTAINVDTWKGIVSLRGNTKKQEQINRAIEIAELQAGVIEVRSYLILEKEASVSGVKEKDITSDNHERSKSKQSWDSPASRSLEGF